MFATAITMMAGLQYLFSYPPLAGPSRQADDAELAELMGLDRRKVYA